LLALSAGFQSLGKLQNLRAALAGGLNIFIIRMTTSDEIVGITNHLRETIYSILTWEEKSLNGNCDEVWFVVGFSSPESPQPFFQLEGTTTFFGTAAV